MKSEIKSRKKFRRNVKRSRYLLSAVSVIGVLFTSLGGSSLEAATPRVSHVLIIWLKRPGNVQDQETLIRAAAHFRRISGVVRVEAGPGLPVTRPGIEQPFDVGIVILFKNRKALASYQNNPRHQLAVRQVLLPLARRFVVYDSLVE